MSSEEWGPWMAHRPGDECPLEDGIIHQVRIWDCELFDVAEDGTDGDRASTWDWGRAAGCPIIAYRVKKDSSHDKT